MNANPAVEILSKERNTAKRCLKALINENSCDLEMIKSFASTFTACNRAINALTDQPKASIKLSPLHPSATSQRIKD